MWAMPTALPTAASHPFYARLNHLLRQHGFDDFAEGQCATFYADTRGRPSLPPGRYFRLLLIGSVEGIDSARGITSRAANSPALRDFLGGVWKTRRRIILGQARLYHRTGWRGRPAIADSLRAPDLPVNALAARRHAKSCRRSTPSADDSRRRAVSMRGPLEQPDTIQKNIA
jgi:hypothetical protein